MNLDMSINGGSIGGTSGFLDWGSSIGRMWGLGMQNGINLAHALRDLEYRGAIEPSQMAAAYNQNRNAAMAYQNAYTRNYNQAEIDAYMRGDAQGLNEFRKQYYDGGGMWGIPVSNQDVSQPNTAAPRNVTNTVVPNGMNNAGTTNTSNAGMTGQLGTNASSAMNKTNQYGQGG